MQQESCEEYQGNVEKGRLSWLLSKRNGVKEFRYAHQQHDSARSYPSHREHAPTLQGGGAQKGAEEEQKHGTNREQIKDGARTRDDAQASSGNRNDDCEAKTDKEQCPHPSSQELTKGLNIARAA